MTRLKDADVKNKCDICQKVFDRKSRLEEHKLIHSTIRPYECPVEGCNKKYRRKTHLVTHCKIAHSVEEDKSFICNVEGCNWAFTLKYQLTKHMKTHETPQPFKCQDCDLLFKTESNLLEHRTIHTGKKKYICEEEGCDASFIVPSKLKSHIFSIHSKECRYSCTSDIENCSEKFKTYMELRKHVASFHKAKCYFCDKTFFNGMNRDIHLSNVHGIFSKDKETLSKLIKERIRLGTKFKIPKNTVTYPCTWTGCEKTFKLQASRDKHISVQHENIKPYSCEICDLSYAYNANLKQHMKNVHSTDSSYNDSLHQKAIEEGKITTNPTVSALTGIPLTDDISSSVDTSENESVAPAQDISKETLKGARLLEILSGYRDANLKYKCAHFNCGVSFNRKYDLDRHVKSIHKKLISKS